MSQERRKGKRSRKNGRGKKKDSLVIEKTSKKNTRLVQTMSRRALFLIYFFPFHTDENLSWKGGRDVASILLCMSNGKGKQRTREKGDVSYHEGENKKGGMRTFA